MAFIPFSLSSGLPSQKNKPCLNQGKPRFCDFSDFNWALTKQFSNQDFLKVLKIHKFSKNKFSQILLMHLVRF